MSSRKTVLITGANRGLGLGLAGSYLAKGHHVIAAARNPDGARELWELERDYGNRCKIVGLDVTSDQDLKRLAKDLAGAPLDLLINNAGVLPHSGAPFPKVTADDLMKAFTVNTIAPLRALQELLPNLLAASQPVVATISSKVGSIADNTSGGMYAYRISKTAVNMMNRSFALEYPKIIAVVLHPGWVQTDMGGANAPTTVADSIAGLTQVIDKLTPKDSGRFFDFRGTELPW
jgi:NAD(P)-dependent dehydrogenase (short-subunit alcohol dehydrogenase family)